MFNSIWTSAGLCSVVSGVVACVFSSIWSSPGLCSVVSVLVLACVVVSGLVLVFVQ